MRPISLIFPFRSPWKNLANAPKFERKRLYGIILVIGGLTAVIVSVALIFLLFYRKKPYHLLQLDLKGLY